jgi:V-type H+-transporting ATPase subunit d
MEAIHIASTPAELYNAVLVDTPLGKYLLCYHKTPIDYILCFPAPFFQDCISEADLDEMNVELIRNNLYKAYLEAFYEFCKDLGGETGEVMCEILSVRFIQF